MKKETETHPNADHRAVHAEEVTRIARCQIVLARRLHGVGLQYEGSSSTDGVECTRIEDIIQRGSARWDIFYKSELISGVSRREETYLRISARDRKNKLYKQGSRERERLREIGETGLG